jgi:predicted transcriptional regulator
MNQTAARLAPETAGSEQQIKLPAKQRSLLELAPLELACMNALWPMGEASVREIRARMAAVRPRAYTTIMTIMDRLARKGIVSRRRVGRAWHYRPNLSAEEARAHAIAQVVEGFFGGSAAALVAQLGKPSSVSSAPLVLEPPAPLDVHLHRKEEAKPEPKRESLPAPAEPLPEAEHEMDETLL